MKKPWPIKSALILSLLLSPLIIFAQNEYKLPPKSIVDLVIAGATNTVQLSASGNYMVTLTKSEMLSVEQLSETKLGLAGYLISRALKTI